MNDRALRSRLIRLAHSNPDLRSEILPLLRTAGDEGIAPEEPEMAPEGVESPEVDEAPSVDNPWGLAVDREGWEEASEAIGEAVDEAVKDIREYHDKIDKAMAKVRGVVHRYAEFGAEDGETYDAINAKLRPFANRKY